jgi:NADP-dependent 3-hydroxy acid dehydrogenase YdfG
LNLGNPIREASESRAEQGERHEREHRRESRRHQAERIKKVYDDIAIPAESFAMPVAFAIGQPEEVDINAILFRPTRQDL